MTLKANGASFLATLRATRLFEGSHDVISCAQRRKSRTRFYFCNCCAQRCSVCPGMNLKPRSQGLFSSVRHHREDPRNWRVWTLCACGYSCVSTGKTQAKEAHNFSSAMHMKFKFRPYACIVRINQRFTHRVSQDTEDPASCYHYHVTNSYNKDSKNNNPDLIAK